MKKLYLVESWLFDFDVPLKFIISGKKNLKSVLYGFTYAWCNQPVNEHFLWENGEQPDPDKLFNECWKDKDFGDIAKVTRLN